MTKRRIALLVSLMFAAPAAVVALEQSAATAEATPSQPAAETAAQPAEVAATSEAATAEAATVEAAAPVPAQERVIVADARPAPARQPASSNPVSRFFSNFAAAATTDAFPMGSMYGDYLTWHLPAQAQYLARLDEQRATEYARLEQQRLAASQPRPAVRAEAVTPAPVSTEQQAAQAGSAEVAMAPDTAALR